MTMDTTPISSNAVGEADPGSKSCNPDNPPRLMITKMELENFKSYGGIKEIGPFHKCFSAVVGPNGSGKSNVIDAMLFVFGKRAKKLRLNKVSELIHKSDAVKKNPPSYARVSVFFNEIIDTGDGDNDYEVIPNTEKIVTRIARKDNTSTYKLDKKNCTFKDVAAYLGSKGIDLDNNRFLILQGEVEMISMMPPTGKNENDEGLLEYLEDIIGSSKYVEQTNLTAEKVEELNDVRLEKLNRVKAVQKEKDNLEGAKQEAEALLSKERDIRRKKSILYQIHLMEQSKATENLTTNKQDIAQKLKAERNQLKESDDRIEELQKALKRQQKEYAKIQEELKTTKAEFTSYERRQIKIKEEIKHTKSENKKIKTKSNAELKKEQNAKQKQSDAKESIPGLEQTIGQLNETKVVEDAKLEQIYDEMKNITHNLRTELEQKTQELAPVDQERAEFQAALDTAVTEVKLLEDSAKRANKKLSAVQIELSTLDSKQQSKRNELGSCEKEFEETKQRLSDAKQEESVLAEKEIVLARRSKELMAKFEESKASLQSSQTNGGRSPAVRGILKAAKKGGELAKVGILGRLGDLTTTTEEYDVAVSTACAMLDHIVVQTTAGAQRCLKFLRKHNLGRANFIPLDKMSKGAHDRQVTTPENAPRLFEVISPLNFAVTPALFLSVGNTLVAPDLETASRWAYDFGRRWRVVTLDGKLIETAGTMSGGGKSVRRGGMRITSKSRQAQISSQKNVQVDDTTAEEVESHRKEVEEATSLLNECRKTRRGLAEEIRNLQKKFKYLETKLPKLLVVISGFDTTREGLTTIIPGLESKCQLSSEETSRIKKLNKEVAKCKTDMASCATLAAKLEADVAALQKKILNAGGAKLKKQQGKCDKVALEIKTAEKEINSAKVAITTSEKAIKKAIKARDSFEKQFISYEQKLEKKETQSTELDENSIAVMESFEKVKTIEEEKRKELDTATKECDELKKNQNKGKFTEIDLMGQVDALEKQLSECKRRKKHWNQEIKKLTQAEEQDDEYDVSDDESEGEEGEENEEIGESNTENAKNSHLVDADGDVQMTGSSSSSKNECETKTRSLRSAKNEKSSSLPTLSVSALESYSMEDIKDDIDTLEKERATLAKNANMGAIAEYRKKEADYLSRVGELDEVTEQRNEVRRTYEDLRRERLEMFMDGFGQITIKLKEMYQMITLGGDAELELVDSLDPFSEGIVFSVRPPKKSWKNISNLSGGEKTLSSLALVFALHHYKPTPLYVMDEIDAALDFKNVSIVGNYIKERTKNAQFIIISLRNNMFELSDRLVGIYKTHDCTKSVTINPRAFGIKGQQNGAGHVKKNTKQTQLPLVDRTNDNENRSEISQKKQRNSIITTTGETM